jgi:chromate transport protein ChrA
MTAKRVWMFLSALLLVVAAVFLWRNNLSTAFVIAALGACAWFLSYRNELRSTTNVDNDESEEEQSEYQDEN